MEIDFIPFIFAFVFGTIIGSFLNVIAYRYNTGFGMHGRSLCMACGKSLVWYELIPLVSFFMQGGKCRKCLTKLSWQYPLVELATGILFTLIFWKFPPTSDAIMASSIIYLLATSVLMVIMVYDTRHKIIPDSMVYIFDAIALGSVFIGGTSVYHAPHFWTLLAGPLLALPFALLWLISKGKWIGLGDAKLVLGIGWILGLVAGINSLILSFWMGAIVGVSWMLISFRRFKKGLEIPFGPFLILGMFLVLFFGLQVIDIRLFTSLF